MIVEAYFHQHAFPIRPNMDKKRTYYLSKRMPGKFRGIILAEKQPLWERSTTCL